MGHHHHEHGHHHGLKGAFWLALIFAIVELVSGLISHSLALLADAAHMLSDVAALALAMLAGRIAQRPAHAGMSYGYGRAKILAAQVNAGMLCLLAVWIVWEAIGRFFNPPQVQGHLVIGVAVIGLVINLIMMKWMHGDHDINTRAAYWHVVGDALGSVVAVISGIIIVTTGWMLVDPILSCLVAMILAWGGWKLICETSMELMEAAPSDVDMPVMIRDLEALDAVRHVHHIHVWRLPSSQLAFSAHIQLDDMQYWLETAASLKKILQSHGMQHVTLQAEVTCMDSSSSSVHGCSS